MRLLRQRAVTVLFDTGQRQACRRPRTCWSPAAALEHGMYRLGAFDAQDGFDGTESQPCMGAPYRIASLLCRRLSEMQAIAARGFQKRHRRVNGMRKRKFTRLVSVSQHGVGISQVPPHGMRGPTEAMAKR